MGKTNTGPDAIRMKAEAMRREQQRKDRRTRVIIFAVVGALIAITAIATALVVWNERSKDGSKGQSDPANAVSWLVSSKGVGQENPDAVTVDEYFDYSCHACADYDAVLAQQVNQAVKDGKVNIRYTPVNVVDMPWHPKAAAAAKVVYEKQPEVFLDFHHRLLAYFKSQFDAQDGSVIQDPVRSAEQVKVIAKEAGVNEDVIATFDDVDASAMLTANTEKWAKAAVEGRAKKDDGTPRIGTPEFVVNGKHLTFTNDTVQKFVETVQEAAGK